MRTCFTGRFVAWILALLCTAAVRADMNNFSILLDTTADYYADGVTPVRDGEYYACVWVRNGTSFRGFNADGTLVNPTEGDNFIYSMRPWAKDGHVENHEFQFDSFYKSYCETGTWNVYVLDTRVTVGEDADGRPVVEMLSVEGPNGSRRPVAVNAWGEVGRVTVVSGTSEVYLKAERLIACTTEIPADTLRPVVSDFRLEGGYAFVTVTNTVPFVRYGVAQADLSGGVPNNTEMAEVPKHGKADGSIVLKIRLDPAKSSGLFRVRRSAEGSPAQ